MQTHSARPGFALVRGLLAATLLLLAPRAHAGGHAPHAPERLPPAPVEKKQPTPSSPLEARLTPDIQARSPEVAGVTLEARLLVVSADGNEPILGAIRQTLDYLGTPYALHVVIQKPGGLTPELLATGTQGHFQGIVLATSTLGYFDGSVWKSALTPDEWQALANYEKSFGVRQVTWYTYPTPALGFGTAVLTRDTSTAPLAASLTDKGKALFPYLSGDPLVLQWAYCYLAPPATGTTTLLTDGHGNSLAAVAKLPDGRENLALTFDGSPYLVHSMALGYGVVNWVTRGLFLGYRRIFIGVQVDDLFLDNDIWNRPETDTLRISGKDLESAARWQDGVRNRLDSPGFWLHLPFNGEGTDPQEYPDDGKLVSTAKKLVSRFKWISHTYTHPYLDALDYATVKQELTENLRVAQDLKMQSNFSTRSLVTPNITGLYNPEAMRAAWDVGVRYVVTDTSMPGQGMTLPNGALRNFVLPEMLMIPRRPTNLFYNVSTPEEWTGEYNQLYRAYWGRDLTYEEILDKESDVLLSYLLKGELAPWMFHQPNLRFFAKEHSLLTDLLDRTFEKYESIYSLPLFSPPMDELGDHAARRLAYSEAQVSARIVPGKALVLSATQDVVVPVTGVDLSCSESYDNEVNVFVKLKAGQTVSVPLDGSNDSAICGH